MSLDSCPVRWAGQQAVVTLPDEIDVTNSGEIRAVLVQALHDGAVVLVADMTATAFCASDGIRALASVQQAAVAAGAQLRVAARRPGVLRVLALTGADRLIDVYPELDAALSGQPLPADADSRAARDGDGS